MNNSKAIEISLGIGSSLECLCSVQHAVKSGSKCHIFKSHGNFRLQASNLSHRVKRTLNDLKSFGGTLETCTELFNWDFKI